MMTTTPMTFTIVRSSSERSWHGFDATVYETTAGVDETHFSAHSVSMHLGSPVRTAISCDGAQVRGVTNAGDLKIIPAGFSRIWEVERPARKFSIRLQPEFVRETAEEIHARGARASVVPGLCVRDARVEHVVWALLAELNAGAESDRLYAESLGTALTVRLLDRNSDASSYSAQRGLPPRRLARVLDYLETHRARDIGLPELAAIAGMSPSHFTVLFKRSLGMPVHRFVVRARVEHALRLLDAGELSLCDVALEAGFANQSHLATWMRRMVGTTPAAYRRERSA